MKNKSNKGLVSKPFRKKKKITSQAKKKTTHIFFYNKRKTTNKSKQKVYNKKKWHYKKRLCGCVCVQSLLLATVVTSPKKYTHTATSVYVNKVSVNNEEVVAEECGDIHRKNLSLSLATIRRNWTHSRVTRATLFY